LRVKKYRKKYFEIILEEYIIFQEIAGYNYYGTETMYSGTDGVEMKAEIFFGIVHYQRLRHMVSDKFQVRNQGPIDQVRFDLNSNEGKRQLQHISWSI
jgi:DNA-directed RNA polymerase beta subunit